jgi:hypothetical protein
MAKGHAVSFVSSTRDILARCMRERGVDNVTAAQLLSGLLDTFEQWKTAHTPRKAAAHGAQIG